VGRHPLQPQHLLNTLVRDDISWDVDSYWDRRLDLPEEYLEEEHPGYGRDDPNLIMEI